MERCTAWIFVLVLVIHINESALEPETISFAGRVNGGKIDLCTKRPYQVSFQYQLSSNHFFHICSGSIIDPQHIVTTANCLYGQRDLSKVRVLAGCTNLYDFEHLHTYTINKVFIHERYNDTTMVNDIAVIRVAETFDLDGESLAAVNLADEVCSPEICLRATGWGYTETPDLSSKCLRVVELQTVSFKDCVENYIKYNDPDVFVDEGMICADSIDKKGACIGDSGAPVTAGGDLVAISSWGDFKCAFPMFPGVFTNIPYYKKWIRERVSSSDRMLDLSPVY